MRIFLYKIMDILSNCKWDLIFYTKMIFQTEFRNLIKSNIKFSNRHRNERCFIVGNGPSLNKLDLTKLNTEIVFTVNEIMRNQSIYETVNSDFHVIIDPTYQKLSPELPEDLATIEILKQINYAKKKPVCITSYEAKKAFQKYGLDKLLDLNFIYQHKNINNYYSSKINMCKNMPSAQNVIQAAIFSAIFMGFKKIYLIGCDMTSVFLTYEANDEGKYAIMSNSHVYDYSENEVFKILKDGIRLDNEYMLHDYAKTFTIFKRIRKYAEKQEIEILNATVGGGLDVFKRIKYDSLFEKDSYPTL